LRETSPPEQSRISDFTLKNIRIYSTRGHGDTEREEDEKDFTQRHRGAENTEEKEKEKPIATGYDAIKDDEFREKLIKLGQTIAQRDRK